MSCYFINGILIKCNIPGIRPLKIHFIIYMTTFKLILFRNFFHWIFLRIIIYFDTFIFYHFKWIKKKIIWIITDTSLLNFLQHIYWHALSSLSYVQHAFIEMTLVRHEAYIGYKFPTESVCCYTFYTSFCI